MAKRERASKHTQKKGSGKGFWRKVIDRTYKIRDEATINKHTELTTDKGQKE